MTEQQQLIPLCKGERLRQVREQRRLSLEEVSAKLRIDLPVMQAIEQDKLEHLAPVYQRGYITTYAQFLDFEKEEIEQMLNSIGYEHPELHTVFPEAGDPNQADRWLKATSYVLASLLVGTLAWQFTHEAVRLSQSGTDLVSRTGLPIEDQSGLPQNPANNGNKAPTHVNASIAALEILQKQRSARTNAGEQAWAALQNSDSTPVTVTPMGDGEFTLDLTTSGDSWVEITDATGQKLEVDLIRAGTSKQYKGKAPFSIQFGRASSISLYMDGQPVDLGPYTTGDVTQMTLGAAESASSSVENDPRNG